MSLQSAAYNCQFVSIQGSKDFVLYWCITTIHHHSIPKDNVTQTHPTIVSVEHHYSPAISRFGMSLCAWYIKGHSVSVQMYRGQRTFPWVIALFTVCMYTYYSMAGYVRLLQQSKALFTLHYITVTIKAILRDLLIRAPPIYILLNQFSIVYVNR